MCLYPCARVCVCVCVHGLDVKRRLGDGLLIGISDLTGLYCTVYGTPKRLFRFIFQFFVQTGDAFAGKDATRRRRGRKDVH